MPINNSVSKTLRSNNPSIKDIRIRSSKTKAAVPMLSDRVIPAGTYESRIAAVAMAKTSRGENAVEVIYELTADDGKVVQGRLLYTLDGYYLDSFNDAMLAAGLPKGSPITDAVNVREQIEIAYPHKGSLAKIVSRRPLEVPAEPAQKPKAQPKAKPKSPAVEVDEDDEFDDFMDDENDDD